MARHLQSGGRIEFSIIHQKTTTMKNTTKWIATVATAAAIFISANVNAQTTTTKTNPDQWHLGIGIEGGAVTGDAKTVSNVDLGGTVRLQYSPADNFAYTLTSGYYAFLPRTIPGTDTKYNTLGIIPVKVGVKLFFAPQIYFGAEAGAGFETDSYNYTKLILSPAVGYASKSWDVGVRYENFSGQGNNFGLVGLRVAYAFPL